MTHWGLNRWTKPTRAQGFALPQQPCTPVTDSHSKSMKGKRGSPSSSAISTLKSFPQSASCSLHVTLNNFSVEAVRKGHYPPLHHLPHPLGDTANDGQFPFLPSLSNMFLRSFQLDSPPYSRAWLTTYSW